MDGVDDRTVAVCDILGFRELVLENDLQALINGKLALFQRLLGYCMDKGPFPELPPRLTELRAQKRIGLAWFSDTVLVYAKSNDKLACRDVIETVGWLLLVTMSTSMRLRAGISHGPLFVDPDNDIYVGQALVEACELEQAQQWSGAALTISAAARIPARRTTGERYQWWVCEYPVPLKESRHVACSKLAVDWTQGIHSGLDLRWSDTRDEPNAEERDRSSSVVEKWHNTRRFHQETCISCFPENRGRDRLKVM